MELPVRENCAVRSIWLSTVESKPVPTAGADACHIAVPAPPEAGTAEPTTDSEVHVPLWKSVADVPPPIDLTVIVMSRTHDTLVFATAFSCHAEDAAAAMFAVGPNLN